MPKRKHHDLIVAWAGGAEIEYKGSNGTWAPIGIPAWYESSQYRIKPQPHKWQKEIDAAKAGEKVQWSTDNGKTWNDWNVDWKYVNLDRAAQDKVGTAFNMTGYVFRVKPEQVVIDAYINDATAALYMPANGGANTRLTYENGVLVKAEVL